MAEVGLSRCWSGLVCPLASSSEASGTGAAPTWPQCSCRGWRGCLCCSACAHIQRSAELMTRLLQSSLTPAPSYTQNGILHMLDRNKRIKPRPERFQNCKDLFDLILTCEERVYDQVVEGEPTDPMPPHVPRPVVLSVPLVPTHTPPLSQPSAPGSIGGALTQGLWPIMFRLRPPVLPVASCGLEGLWCVQSMREQRAGTWALRVTMLLLDALPQDRLHV